MNVDNPTVSGIKGARTPRPRCPAGARRGIRRGFTLIELSLAISVGLAVAAIALTLLNQQAAFLHIFRAQDFLTREAPVINNYLARVIGHAEGYRLHHSFEDAVAHVTPVLDEATALVLRFKEPNGVFREAILAFHDPGGGLGRGLHYHLVEADGSVGPPQWAVSKQPVGVVFSIEEGILRLRLHGPNGEEIIYSGAQQL